MNKERDAETWDGGEVSDGMIVRGDLTIGDMTEEEIAAFGPEAQAVLREQAAAKLAAAPRRRIAPIALTAMAVVAAMGGADAPDPFARRRKLDAANSWRISETDFNAQTIAAAKSKRERKAARRLALKSAGEVPSSVTSINTND